MVCLDICLSRKNPFWSSVATPKRPPRDPPTNLRALPRTSIFLIMSSSSLTPFLLTKCAACAGPRHRNRARMALRASRLSSPFLWLRRLSKWFTAVNLCTHSYPESLGACPRRCPPLNGKDRRVHETVFRRTTRLDAGRLPCRSSRMGRVVSRVGPKFFIRLLLDRREPLHDPATAAIATAAKEDVLGDDRDQREAHADAK